MAAEKAIVNILEDDAAVGALAGDRIYPQLADPDAALPYIVYRRQRPNERIGSLDGSSGLNQETFELDCVSTDYSEAKSLADSVRTALDGKSGTYAAVIVQGIFVDDGEDEFALQMEGSEIAERSIALVITAFAQE